MSRGCGPLQRRILDELRKELGHNNLETDDALGIAGEIIEVMKEDETFNG